MGLDGLAARNDKPRRFAAFISYAHADAAVAAKLQSRLERYRLPKHLADSFADGQATLGQIFRDREDLAAAPSLSAAIHAAIAEAEALIVICSPDAVASRWVGEEIALFRTLHPGKPILAAVVRSEPEQAFPAALTEGGNEPLAADLRKKGDGEALGFLKIVAGIAAVPLDALVQRDAQRRIRRVMWITGAALAAMLVMGVMTTLALTARNEAARQRESAEGLVEYMLTDLRDKLKGVGRLDVMEGVNARAGKYYGDGSIKGSLLKAQVLHAIGEDYDKQGNLKQANAKFREAYVQTAKLIKTNPIHPDVIFTHAQSEFWIGFIALKNDELPKTFESWNAYADLALSLEKLEPFAVRSLMERGYSETNLCDLHSKDETTLQKAIEHCHIAVRYMEKAWRKSLGDSKIGDSLANNYGWLADIYAKNGDMVAAIAMREKEATIYQKMLKTDPKNQLYWQSLATSWMGKGRVLHKQLRFEAALKSMRDADTLFAKLVADEPANAETRIWRLRNTIHIFESLKAAGAGNPSDVRASALEMLGYLVKTGAISGSERITYSQRLH
jgi:tetratricopeptide (TPR) repeat protein